jgi:hypothetical protein
MAELGTADRGYLMQPEGMLEFLARLLGAPAAPRARRDVYVGTTALLADKERAV